MNLPDFVDRQLRDMLITYFETPPNDKKMILLDSPAGMGKTYLMTQVCLSLLEHARTKRNRHWKFIRLDFRGPQAYHTRTHILEEIARQFCSDLRWDTICNQLSQAAQNDPGSLELLKRITKVPLSEDAEAALLRTLSNIVKEDMQSIGNALVRLFRDAPIQELQDQAAFHKENVQIYALIEFVQALRERQEQSARKKDAEPFPTHAILILDSLENIADPDLLKWVLNRLAPELHNGLQGIAVQNFFVIAMGRFISHNLEMGTRKLYFSRYELDPFPKTVVEDLLRCFEDQQFSDPKNAAQVSQLARKLTWVCGGHPRLLNKVVLTLYNRPLHFSSLRHDPRDRMYWYNNPVLGIQQILINERQMAIGEITSILSQEEKQTLELLSVFRNFNVATLDFILNKIATLNQPGAWPQFSSNVRKLFDQIEGRRLIGSSRVAPFYSGHVVLRLIATQMLAQDPPTRFCQLNQWALEMFENWVRGCFPNNPDRPQPIPGDYQKICVVEWLFHRLCLARYCPDKNPLDQSPGRSALIDLAQDISDQLANILQNVVDFPYLANSRVQQIHEIATAIEDDEQIDHLIHEIAWEDQALYDDIRSRILMAFA